MTGMTLDPKLDNVLIVGNVNFDKNFISNLTYQNGKIVNVNSKYI